MAERTHIVMNEHGDTRVTYDTNKESEVAKAMDEFNELVKTHTAARKTAPGEFELVRDYTPEDTELVFFRKVVGG